MPKIACRCGFIHDLSPVPDHGYLTIRDTEVCEVLDKGGTIDDVETGLLYECPECGRILWQKPGVRSNSFSCFKPELPDHSPHSNT
jgi:hypothetical protein